MVDHIFFYENFRNYMFPHVYTKVLDYHTYDGELSWGWVNQGIINIIGCLISEDITPPVAFYYFGKDRGEFMASMEASLMTYIHDEQYNQENTFMRERLPWHHSSSVDNLYSGLWSFLYRKCGGTEFLKGFFHSLPELLSRAPSSKQDYLTAMENFYIAASIGAKHDLSAFFEGDLRWQIGADALEYVQSKGLAPMSLSATTTTSTTTMPAPVCSSWQLRIAEDNPRGWEAHIFEIELFNGDDLISGAGKGRASSDCKHWAGSPEGAFDGDLSTKWVTCSGSAKVGKGITYELNQPNAVTKIKTHQWGSANNAIPKFDLYCSHGRCYLHLRGGPPTWATVPTPKRPIPGWQLPQRQSRQRLPPCPHQCAPRGSCGSRRTIPGAGRRTSLRSSSSTAMTSSQELGRAPQAPTASTGRGPPRAPSTVTCPRSG